jgi:ankyrin repeat protein
MSVATVEAPIIWECARCNNLERLRLLLDKVKHGCKTTKAIESIVNFSPCDAGTTALTIASGKGYTEAVSLLLENGADANIQNRDGTSPLHRACENGHLNIIKLLLDYGAHANAFDTERNTPLHLTAATNFLEPIDLLIESHADLDLRNCGRQTPYDIAKFCDNKAAMSLLNAAARDRALYNHVFERSLMKKVMKKWHEVAQKFFSARKERRTMLEQTAV